LYSFSQEKIFDADSCLWLTTDTTNNKMQYTNIDGDIIEVRPIAKGMINAEILNAHVLKQQYHLWSDLKRLCEFEPYAAAFYSVLFNAQMDVLEIRILRREAYSKDFDTDSILIQSIKNALATLDLNKNRKRKGLNELFVGRARVVMPK